MIKDSTIIDHAAEPTTQEEEYELLSKVSFQAVIGATHPRMLWVIGKIDIKKLIVLIDSDCTHNLIIKWYIIWACE